MKNKINILALSGSLRKESYNTALLEAIRELAPDHVVVDVYKKLGELPLFNPDLDEENVVVFQNLKQHLVESQGLIIACPEYAHGISGVLKNALDWLVAVEAFVDMPVVLLNASPRASHAQNALKEVVTTMSACVFEKACISVPLLGSRLNAEGITQHYDIASLLCSSLAEFYRAIEDKCKQQ